MQEEEGFLIECVQHLLKHKGVPKENIKIKCPFPRFGSQGKNWLEPDIVVFDRPKKEAMPSDDVNTDCVIYVAEVKVRFSQKKSALKRQLFPALGFCKNAKWGIYWDASNRLAINKETKEESSIMHLPKFGDEESQITKNDLEPLRRGDSIWDMIEQTIRNHQGGDAKHYYRDILKLLISKYYDERFNDQLMFCVRYGNDDNFFKRITNLCEEARQHYRLHDEFKEIVAEKISLNDETLKACVSALESYSLINTDRVVIQEFYMRFAPYFLKKDLNQHYTPKEIVSFMTGNFKITKKTTAIDPCSGSGDFMVGLLRKAKKDEVEKVEDNLHCWDIDKNAAALAQINMILNGDGKSHVKVLNSLDLYEEDNGRYDFVITNPPFGKDTIYDGKHRDKYMIEDNVTGKLFIERGLNLLKKDGILVSVIPTGYIVNPKDQPFREFVFEKSRVLGCVNLPVEAFIFSGAKTLASILFLQKTRLEKNYKIFVADAKIIGFENKKKKSIPVLERRERDGVFITDQENNRVVINDLIKISNQLKSFAKDENLTHFECPNPYEKYCHTDVKSVKESGYIINTKIYDRSDDYGQSVKKIKEDKYFCLNEEGILIENCNDFDKVDTEMYRFVRTGNVSKDNVKNIKKLRGWQLPERARQTVETNDILIAKMGGSLTNFFYVFEVYSDIVASNGFYKVRIHDEKKRLSFYRFLFSEDYVNQASALTTGSIMADIKIDILANSIYVPYLKNGEMKKIREFLQDKDKFLQTAFSIGIFS